jgi:hypothetical protein
LKLIDVFDIASAVESFLTLLIGALYLGVELDNLPTVVRAYAIGLFLVEAFR